MPVAFTSGELRICVPTESPPSLPFASLLAEQAQRYARIYFKIAYDVSHNAAEAEDAVQRALLKAWENRDTIRSHQAIHAWLAQTIVRESLTDSRRKRVAARVHDVLRQQSPHDQSPATDSFDSREKIIAEIADLPADIRTVITLRFLSGMTGEQIREVVNCSNAEVSRRLHRGMELLRQKLKSLEPLTR